MSTGISIFNNIFPSGIDPFVPLQNFVDDVFADDVNSLQRSVVAIETYLIPPSGAGNTFVFRSGDSMYGDLNMSGSTIIYASNISENTLGGNINTNGSIVPTSSGVNDLGSPTNPFRTLYADDMVDTSGSSTFVKRAGDDMYGPLTMSADILASGLISIGSTGNPIDIIYVNSIISTGNEGEFVNVTGDSMIGPLTMENSNIVLSGTSEITGLSSVRVLSPTYVEIGDSTSNNSYLNIDQANGEFTLHTSGNDSIYGQPNTITITSPSVRILGDVEVSGDVAPWNTSAFDLGSTSNQWRGIYVDGVASTGSVAISSPVEITTSGSIIPVQSGTDDLGSLQRPFRTIYADDLVDTSGTSTFVKRAGDDMYGSLIMTDADVVLSGTSKITGLSSINVLSPTYIEVGDSTTNNSYLNIDQAVGEFTLNTSGNDSIYGQVGIVTTTSPIIRNIGDVEVSGDVVPWESGVFDLGSTGLHWGTIYVDNIVSSGGAGEYVNVTGDTMIGNLKMSGSTAIVTSFVRGNAGTSLEIYSENSLNMFPKNFEIQTTGVGLAGTLNLRTNGGDINIQQLGPSASEINIEMLGSGSINIDATYDPNSYATMYSFKTLELGSQAEVIYLWAPSSGVQVASSTDVIPESNGLQDLGSSTKHWGTIYVDNIVSSGGAGEYVNVTGDTMTGDLSFTGLAGIYDANKLTITASGLDIVNTPTSTPLAQLSEASISLNGYSQVNATSIPRLSASDTNLSLSLYDTPSNSSYNAFSAASTSLGLYLWDATNLSSRSVLSASNTNLNLSLYDSSTSTIYNSFSSSAVSISMNMFDVNMGSSWQSFYSTPTYVSLTLFDTGTSTNWDAFNATPVSIYLNGYNDVYGQYSRLNLSDANTYLNGYNAVDGVYSRLNLSDANTYLNGSDAIGGQYSRLSLSDASSYLNGYVSGYGQYSRLSLTDSSSQLTGYISGYGTYSRLDLSDSTTYLNGYVSGYGQLQRLSITDGEFYNSGYDVGYGVTQRLYVSNDQFYVKAYVSGTLSWGQITRIQADDNSFSSYGSYQGQQHNLIYIDDTYSNLYGYNAASGNSYARMNLFDTYAIINGYDVAIDSTHDLLNIQDSEFFIKDYISGSGQFTTIQGNRTQTQVHSASLKVDGDILANVANTQNIGSSGTPFSGIYATTINGESVVIAKLNEKPSGTTDGVNNVFTLAFAPFPESTQLFNNGIYMIVSGTDYPTDFDYSVSSNTLTFVDAPASGAKLVINYNYV